MNRKFARCLLIILFLTVITTVLPISFSIDWLPEMRLTWDEEWDNAPSVTYANDGRIWIFWHTYRTSNAEIFYKIYDPYQVDPWSSEMQLTDHQRTDATPYAMQAADGNIWVVWMTNRLLDYEIFYKIFNGTAWSNATRLTLDSSRDELPAILQTTDGTIWVFWDSDRTGNYDIFYKTTTNNGVNWTTSTPLTSSGTDEWDPSVVQSADGKIWLAFTKVDDIYYMVYDGVSWTSQTQLTSDRAYDWHPSIVQDSKGDILVFWDADRIPDEFGDPQTDIFYKVYDGVSWSSDAQLTINTIDDDMPAAALDSSGVTWVVWSSAREDAQYDLYYRTTLIGDIDGDGDVDSDDLHVFGGAYGSSVGDPAYNADADIDGDSDVDVSDLYKFARNFGKGI